MILVSHAMNDVAQFCRRALFLERGGVRFLGPAMDAVKLYMLAASALPGKAAGHMQADDAPRLRVQGFGEDDFWPPEGDFLDISGAGRAESGLAVCRRVALLDGSGTPCAAFEQGDTAVFFVEYRAQADLETPVAGVELISDKGVIVFGKNTLQFDCLVPERVPQGALLRFRYEVKLCLAVGEYTFGVGLTAMSPADYARRAELTHPELDARNTVLSTLSGVAGLAVTFRAVGSGPVQLTHHGVADLPGAASLSFLPGEADTL